VKIGQGGIVYHNPAAQIRLKTPDQQKYAIIETAIDPLIMPFHKLAGLVFVTGKSKKYDKHWIYIPINLDGQACKLSD
jgi:hypothetical protein